MSDTDLAPPPDGTLVEKIDKKDIVPLNNPKCAHVFAIDDEDATDDYYAEKCLKCPIGRLVRIKS